MVDIARSERFFLYTIVELAHMVFRFRLKVSYVEINLESDLC